MRKSWKTYLLAFCMLSMLFQQYVYAQAALAPVENYVVNRAIGGIIANRIAVARGVAANDAAWLATAANDPVYKATMAGVSGTMTAANVASTALGVGLAIAGAPVWLTIAASLGVVGLGAWIAYDATTGTNISISPQGSGNKIIVTNKPVAAPAYPGGSPTGNGYGVDLAVSQGAQMYRSPSSCTSGQPCYQLPALPASVPMKYSSGNVVLVAATVQELGKYYVNMITPSLCLEACGFTGVTFKMESAGSGFTYADDGTPKWYVWIHESRTGGDAQGLPSYDRTYSTYPTGAQFSPGSYPAAYSDLNTAYSAIGLDLKAAKVSPQILADIANKAWQQAAAKPGYAGEPYPAANPVTSADVATWTAANPSSVPKLDDLLRPAQNPATSPEGVPISPTVQPGTQTNPNPNPVPGTNPNVNVVNTPNVNIVNNPRVDLGPDPGTPDPTLETAPTATEILSPLTGLFPELRLYQTPGHAGECPKPSFDVFGKSIVMDSHCTIAEQHRATLAAVMLAVWLLVGLLILLSA